MKKKARNLLTYFLALVLTLVFTASPMQVNNASAAEVVKPSATEVVSLKEVYKDHFLINSNFNKFHLLSMESYN